MKEFSDKINAICGVFHFKNLLELEENLNEDGLDKLNNCDVNFMKNYDKRKCNGKYLKNNGGGDISITNISEFSYLLGVLVHFQKSHSKSKDVGSMGVAEYRNNSKKNAIDKYLILCDKYQHNRDSNSLFYNKLNSALLSYMGNDDFVEIDYLLFYSGTVKSKEHIWKSEK
jgi:hypothetical protein